MGKRGRIVILLARRRAGKKAIIVKQNDDGKKDKKFAHALVVGIERSPRRVTRSMNAKKQERKSRMKPFVKYVTTTISSPPDSWSRMTLNSDPPSPKTSWLTERPERPFSLNSRPTSRTDTCRTRVPRSKLTLTSSSANSDSEQSYALPTLTLVLGTTTSTLS